MSSYRFPSELKSENAIIFKARPYGTGSAGSTADIALYTPLGISVGDGASYGAMDLGVLGSQAADKVMKGGTDKANVEKQINEGDFTENAQKLLTKALVNRLGGGGGLADQVVTNDLRKSGVAFNPNSVLSFTNTNIREYSFEFRMIATSKQESQDIKAIINLFRERMYPVNAEQGIALEYPDIWEITYMSYDGFIPNPADCFLTSLNTVYNPTSNMRFDGGAPVDVTVQISFQEFRALHRGDIIELNKGNRITLGGDQS